jgi:hypothetical protein
VRNGDPIREVSGESCDKVSDSAFPSVFGTEHDVLLLSQSFDDAASMSDFRAPSGTSTIGYMRGNQDVSLDMSHPLLIVALKLVAMFSYTSTFSRLAFYMEKNLIIQDLLE